MGPVTYPSFLQQATQTGEQPRFAQKPIPKNEELPDGSTGDV